MNKKQGIIGALIVLMLSPALALAQTPESMLEDLRGKVEKEDINLIDFEEVRPWGNLNAQEITAIEDLLAPYRVPAPKPGEGIMNLLREITGQETQEGTKPIESLADLKTFFRISQDIDITQEPQKAADELMLMVLTAAGSQTDVRLLTPDKIRQIITEAGASGEAQAYSIAITIAKTIRNLMASIAALWILLMGIQMVAAQGEEAKITELKNGITWALIGLAIILVAQPVIEAIYGAPGSATGLIRRTELSREIAGIISFVKALLGAVAVFMIVLAGFKTIAAQGDEEKITQEKKAIAWVVIGLILVVINESLIEYLFINPAESGDSFTATTIKGAINVVGNVVQFLLGFLGLLALGVFVYGGATYIISFGDEEASAKGKTMITNAVIGIVIILSAFAIVRTLIVQIP